MKRLYQSVLAGTAGFVVASAAYAQDTQVPVTDIATLLQSAENCLAWMNNGFPDRTPFDGGFETVQPFGDEGMAVYREGDTGFEITVTRDSGMASCESSDGMVRLGADGLELLYGQMLDRLEDGRAVRLEEGQYAYCAGPAGLLTVEMQEEGMATFVMEFGTDTALELAGGC